MIIYLLLKRGMSEIEVVCANVEDYQATPEGHILRVQGKGRHDKTEFVVISRKCKSGWSGIWPRACLSMAGSRCL